MNENQSMKRESKSEFIKRNRQLAKWKAGNISFQSVLKTCRVCISAIPPTLINDFLFYASENNWYFRTIKNL